MNLLDHEWVQDHIAAHVAEGLPADERARIEAHASECSVCRTDLQEARAFDRSVGELFASARAQSGLEERVIRGLRAAPAKRRLSLPARLGLGLAAAALMGVTGFLYQGMQRKEVPPADPLPSIARNDQTIAPTERLGVNVTTKLYSQDAHLSKRESATVFGGGWTVADGTEMGTPIVTNGSTYYQYRNDSAGITNGSGAEYFHLSDTFGRPATERPLEKTEPTADPKWTSQETDRKIIRTGEMEFEIESFDSAVASIIKIVKEEGGSVATVNSAKLPNGKTKGSVVVRVPPDHMDTLILKLRALGDLKSQRVGSEDITKQYTDLESRLRAARTMEERLLKIIKDGKGEIKDLLLAEKELGEWRTKIESLEGEIRYYANLVALSTLTIALYEREILSPAGITESEQIQMGLETDDVEKTYQAALAAVADAKGRVTKSELKQHAAGQFTAVVDFEVAPEAAGPLRDRLKQLGTVSRLEIKLVQQTEGGSGRPTGTAVKRTEARFFLSLYNLANIAPRETVVLHLASGDAEESFKRAVARVEKAGGRVVSSNLNRQKNEQTTGMVQFEVKSSEAEAVLADLRSLGEVMHLQVLENPDAQNVTKSKRGFQCQIFAMGQVAPRETVTIQLAAQDVAKSYESLRDAVQKAGGRILSAQLNETDRRNATATLDFEVPRGQEAAVLAVLNTAGGVLSRNSSRAQDANNVVDSKLRMVLSVMDVANVPPRETLNLTIEVDDVDKALAAVRGMGGRVVESHVTRERSGRITGTIVIDLPLASAGGAADRISALGTVRAAEASKNSSVPDGPTAVARLNVVVSNSESIVPSDRGVWPQVKKGLSTSFVAATWSLNFILIGACVLVPWALLGWGGWRVYRRLRKKAATAA